VSKRPTVSAKQISTRPIAPRLGDELHESRLGALLDDDQWTSSTIAHDLSGQQLRRRDVSECRFVGCRLTGADLQGARLVDVEFVDCELSGTSLAEAVLTRVELRNCRLSGALLTSAKLRDVNVVECKADFLNMRMTASERVTFERTMLPDADFYGASLQSCRLFDCDLTSVEFSTATFVDTRLHGSDLSSLRGIENVRGVTIDPDQVHDFTLALLAAHNVTVEPGRETAVPDS
jgi:uncharacterized protein YjbI with pentapeptide repeats